jgi:TRAP-type C4-dicarboxylate transport system permease small subunit
MTEHPGPPPPAAADPPPAGRVERALDRLCRLFAGGGGLILAGMAAMTTLSVGGRYLAGLPIPGDFEMVEIGCAMAVFAFLPYCQMQRGNVVVDFVLAAAPRRLNALLDTAGAALYTAIAGLLLWRMTLGGIDVRSSGEATMIIGIPRWWGFLTIVPSLVLLVAVCAFTVWRSLREARS